MNELIKQARSNGCTLPISKMKELSIASLEFIVKLSSEYGGKNK